MPHPARRTPRFSYLTDLVRYAAGAALLLAATGPAGAVQPERFEHSTESDFADGTFDGTAVTNLGDLKLAADTQALGDLSEDAAFVYDLATVGGVTYAAVGPEGRVLAWAGEAWEVQADFESAQVFALLAYEGALIAAVSGDDAALHVLTGGDKGAVVPLPGDVRYIWDTVATDGGLAVATGPEGKVFNVDASGAVREVLDTAQANVLALAAGRGPNAGQLFAGTDTDGLVYRIDAAGRALVIYDAPEPEVSALVVAADGTLYAGTADAEQATPGRLEEPVEDEEGRPDADAEDKAADAEAADTAQPSEAPSPPADLAVAGSDAEAKPDYDALREEVRRRIAAAAEGRAASAAKATKANPTRRARAEASGGDTEGNAVYRVDPRGFVSEVFRESVMVLSLALTEDETLLVATGDEGQLYRVDPAAGETTLLTELDGQQLLALLPDPAKGVTVAAANPAGVHRLGGSCADEGTYASSTLDAEQVSLWGTARLSVNMPAGSRVAFATRSGNVQDPDIGGATGWSDWSEPQVLQPGDGGVAPLEAVVEAPPARFLQYRLTLTSSGDDAAAPVLTGLSIAYVTPNLRPTLSALTAEYPDFPGVDKPASPVMTAEWEAEDPNEDRLTYTLQQRPASAGESAGPWLTLVEATDDTSFEWDTRRVPDGYYQLRVRAQDDADNPGTMALTAARKSDPVLVDNTAPTLSDVQIAVDGRSAVVTGLAIDAHSPIHSVAYRLDDAEDESPLLPGDLIYDSTREAWSITLSDLSRGPHLLSLRVTDLRGNRSFHARRFDVE